MLKRGEVVKDRWRIEERLGKGTFCELHRASDLTKKTKGAAVKVEVQGMQRSVLKVRTNRVRCWEASGSKRKCRLFIASWVHECVAGVRVGAVVFG